MIVINVTRLDWANFSMTISVSIANETVIIEKPATVNTTGPYNITYLYVPQNSAKCRNHVFLDHVHLATLTNPTIPNPYDVEHLMLRKIPRITAIQSWKAESGH